MTEVSRVAGEAVAGAPSDEMLALERDMQIAREIQQGFLPASLPTADGYELSAYFHPAREVAGDFYDAFHMSRGRRLGFVVGDVCDKGVGAALFMALFRTLVRANAQHVHSLSWLQAGTGTDDNEEWLTGDAVRGRASLPSIGTGALLNAVAGTNDYVVENHMTQGYFVTLFFGVLDPDTGAITYINGGHNPPVIVRRDGTREYLKPTGPAVGMMPDVRFAMARTRLEPGDLLFAYTDGVTDARSADGSFFGESRLFEFVGRGRGSAQELVDRLESLLHEHMGTAVQFDDITMLALRRELRPDERE